MSRLLPRLLADKEYFEMSRLQSDLTSVEVLKYKKKLKKKFGTTIVY